MAWECRQLSSRCKKGFKMRRGKKAWSIVIFTVNYESMHIICKNTATWLKKLANTIIGDKMIDWKIIGHIFLRNYWIKNKYVSFLKVELKLPFSPTIYAICITCIHKAHFNHGQMFCLLVKVKANHLDLCWIFFLFQLF